MQGEINKKAVEADVAGVQVNSDTIGHQQFYQVAKLSVLSYSANTSELYFKVNLMPQHAIQGAQRIDNIVLFINGCDLCICGASKIICKGGLK